MSRRLFLVALAPLLAIAAHAAQPNIILLFADDLTPQAISAYENPLKLLETPGMDRLAREGMLFARAVGPNSICGPNHR